MNTFPGLVHTARHTMGVSNARSQLPNRKEGAAEDVAVNTFPGLVHTARHTMGVSNARSQ